MGERGTVHGSWGGGGGGGGGGWGGWGGGGGGGGGGGWVEGERRRKLELLPTLIAGHNSLLP